MMSEYKGDKVLFEQGRWLIIEDLTCFQDNDVWFVHRCNDDWEHDHYFLVPDVCACLGCGKPLPSIIKTLFLLLR